MDQKTTKTAGENEVCLIIRGALGKWFWVGAHYLVNDFDNTPVSVSFMAQTALDIENQYGDVLGFWHSHPGMPAVPSARDLRTFRAWRLSLGRPLVCLIEGTDGLRAWWFMDDESAPFEADVEFIGNQYVGLTPKPGDPDDEDEYEPCAGEDWADDMRCADCGYEGEADDFAPTDGRPMVPTCPECEKTNIFEKEAADGT